MAVNLSDLTQKELDTLITQAKRRKATLKKRKPIATVRSRITAQAEAEGYTIEELFGGATVKKTAVRKAAKKATRKGRKLGKVPPKYRNTADKSETWTGRGKQPRWLAAQVAKGKKVEDFLIKK